MSATTDDVELHLEQKIRQGCWFVVQVELADGAKLELRVPGVVGASATSLSAQEPGERASIRFTDSSGHTRTGRLTQMGL